MEIIRGVEDVAHASGVGTVVSAIHRRTSSAKQWLDNMRTRSTEGVIFVTSMVEPPLQAELRRLNIPVVIVDPAGVPPRRRPRSARPTGRAACAPPSTCSASATGGSASSPARRS